jgi:signal transduction histidine kinase
MTLKVQLRNGRKIWRIFLQPQPSSLEYRRWCDRLIRQRFWLGIILVMLYWSIQGFADFYEIFINSDRLLRNLDRNNLRYLFETIRQNFILHKIVLAGSLGCLVLFWRSTWGRKRPALFLVLMPWAIAFIPEMIVGSVLGIPRDPSTIMFMAQAVIAPIHWRLHLVAQALPMFWYFTIYPLIGLGTFARESIYSSSFTVQTILVCIICEVGVYLYEKSKQAELAANQRLKLFMDSITHDLRTPVMGSLILLQSIRDSTPTDQPVQISQLEMTQLIEGSDRLLRLMNTLLDSQALSQPELALNRQPAHLKEIVSTTLQDFTRDLVKHQVQLENRIRSDLPQIEGDSQQIARVFHNLIGNAIRHNPPGLTLTLDAVPILHKTMERSRPMLKVMIQDNGIGIAPEQQETIFEPYTTGDRNQYRPGLGLGLYICRQIVLSHGGEIRLEELAPQTVFSFTLPIAEKGAHLPIP